MTGGAFHDVAETQLFVTVRLSRYRWAFIGGAVAGESERDQEEEAPEDGKKKKETRRKQATFSPHIIRLARLLNSRVKTSGFQTIVKRH